MDAIEESAASGSIEEHATTDDRDVVTSLTYKRRKRGKEGPDHCITPAQTSAVSQAIASSNIRQGEAVFYPHVGTTFGSFEEAKEFYNYYSWEIGFGIRESRSKKNSNNYITRKDLVCSCEGICSNPLTSSARTGCKAMIRLHRTADHSWVITETITSHNHPLSVGCGEKKQWGSHSFIDPMTREFIRRLRRNNVALGRVCSIVGVHNEENEVHIKKQAVRGLCARLAQEDIKDDMKKTIEILKSMELQDADFEVRFRTDSKGVIESMIWCTGKNKKDYQLFGDVVTFDTTYRTNLYNLPFGIFVGVNNHFQSIIYGGVLLRHERTIDFEWAFKNFTDIMEGKMPSTILTDQCQAMASAIKAVLPGTRHRWCRWHVLRLAKQKIGPTYSKKSGFKKKFNMLVTNETSPSEFEKRWHELIAEYKLQDNKFIKRAFRTRGMWAKPYFMEIFCAGMTSTQRSESANHMLKRFIQRGAPMHIFVTKFRDFQFDRNQEEERENHRTKQQTRRKRVGVPIEKHAADIYTRELHERFYRELFESGSYSILHKSSNNQHFTLVHSNDKGKSDARRFEVNVIGREKVICSCGLYEHLGMPCKHSLKVLVHLDIDEIPPGNIHTRWLKSGVSELQQTQAESIISHVAAQSIEVKRRILIMKALELSQTRGPIDDNAIEEAIQAMESIMPAKQVTNIDGNGSTSQGVGDNLHDSISCPPRAVKNGRPAGTSLKSWKRQTKLEKEVKRRTDSTTDLSSTNEEVAVAYKTRRLSDLLHVTSSTRSRN